MFHKIILVNLVFLHAYAGIRSSEDEQGLKFEFIDETLREVLKGIYRLRKVHKVRFPNLAATFSAQLVATWLS